MYVKRGRKYFSELLLFLRKIKTAVSEKGRWFFGKGKTSFHGKRVRNIGSGIFSSPLSAAAVSKGGNTFQEKRGFLKQGQHPVGDYLPMQGTEPAVLCKSAASRRAGQRDTEADVSAFQKRCSRMKLKS